MFNVEAGVGLGRAHRDVARCTPRCHLLRKVWSSETSRSERRHVPVVIRGFCQNASAEYLGWGAGAQPLAGRQQKGGGSQITIAHIDGSGQHESVLSRPMR